MDSSVLPILNSTDHIHVGTEETPIENNNNNAERTTATCTNTNHQTLEDEFKCKTKLGDKLMKIIQNRTLVRKFDELRAELKEQRKGKKKQKHKQQYRYYEKKVKLEVQSCLAKSEAQIDKFRTDFTARAGCPPSAKDYPTNINGLLSLCKTCKTVLMNEWNA